MLINNFLAAICKLLLDETLPMLVSLLKSIVSASATSFMLKGRGVFFHDIFLYFCKIFLAAICAFLFLQYEVLTLIFLGEILSSMSVVLFIFLDVFFNSMLFKLSIFISSRLLMLVSLL